MLRWLKTVVVRDVEKAHEIRQVGIGKTSGGDREDGAQSSFSDYSIR
jgi:hypothetical protein